MALDSHRESHGLTMAPVAGECSRGDTMYINNQKVLSRKGSIKKRKSHKDDNAGLGKT